MSGALVDNVRYRAAQEKVSATQPNPHAQKCDVHRSLAMVIEGDRLRQSLHLQKGIADGQEQSAYL